MSAYSEITANDNRIGFLTRLLRATRKRLTGVSLSAEDVTAVETETPPCEEDVMDEDTKKAMAQVLAEYGARSDAYEYEDSLAREVEEAPVVRLATTILQQAIKDGASYIHVEPYASSVGVRFRIDGILHEVMQMPGYIQQPLTQRFKVLADIVGRGAPQVGTIGIQYGKKPYDIRLATLPALHGEKLTFKIHDHAVPTAGLNKLGFTAETQQSLEWLCERANGLLICAGTPDSGTTTTAYSLLNRLNSGDKNLVTIGKDREYRLPGISSVLWDMGSASKLSAIFDSLCYQNVDVLFVDEIRDAESARLVLNAARDRLVITTLRVPSAVAALQQMNEWSDDPTLVTRTVKGILAQRLVRKICKNCIEYYDMPARDLRMFGFKIEDESQTVQIARGTGCPECRNSGYRGQLGVYELLKMDAWMGDLLQRKADAAQLLDIARGSGMHLLREDGLIKILEGMTTPDDIFRQDFESL